MRIDFESYHPRCRMSEMMCDAASKVRTDDNGIRDRLIKAACSVLFAACLCGPAQAHTFTPTSPGFSAPLKEVGWGKSAWDGIRHVAEEIAKHETIAELLAYLRSLFHHLDDDPSLPPEERVCRALRKLVTKVREIEHLTAKEKAGIVSRFEGVMASKCKLDEQTTVLQKADKQK